MIYERVIWKPLFTSFGIYNKQQNR